MMLSVGNTGPIPYNHQREVKEKARTIYSIPMFKVLNGVRLPESRASARKQKSSNFSTKSHISAIYPAC